MATINKIPKCPPLRFPDFNDDWTQTTLGEVAEIKKGSGLSKEDLTESGQPVILYGELYTTYTKEVIDTIYSKTNVNSEKLVVTNGGEVIIPSSGETAWDIATARCVIPSNVILGGDLNIITLKKDNGAFFSYFLNGVRKRAIAEIAQGSSVVHLYGKDIIKLSISLPSLAEQKRIADFLSLIDERIQSCSETIRELKNQKAALLNQLFSQKLRFPDFNDEWTQTTLGEILLEESERNSKNINRVISSTINGLFDQKEYFNRDIASKDISNYKILKRNQLVLSPQNIWMGNINVNLRFDVGIVSPSYKIYSLDHDSIDFRFASYALKTPIMLQRYKDSSSQGASVVRRNLDIDSFYSVTLPLPSLEEQKKIADFLSLIDERIEAEEQLLKKYEEQKKYLLRHMFV